MNSPQLEPISEGRSETDPVSESGPQLVIWGTNVVVSVCKTKFKNFILRYIDPEAENDEISENIDLNAPLYLQKLDEVTTHYLNENYKKKSDKHP